MMASISAGGHRFGCVGGEIGHGVPLREFPSSQPCRDQERQARARVGAGPCQPAGRTCANAVTGRNPVLHNGHGFAFRDRGRRSGARAAAPGSARAPSAGAAPGAVRPRRHARGRRWRLVHRAPPVDLARLARRGMAGARRRRDLAPAAAQRRATPRNARSSPPVKRRGRGCAARPWPACWRSGRPTRAGSASAPPWWWTGSRPWMAISRAGFRRRPSPCSRRWPCSPPPWRPTSPPSPCCSPPGCFTRSPPRFRASAPRRRAAPSSTRCSACPAASSTGSAACPPWCCSTGRRRKRRRSATRRMSCAPAPSACCASPSCPRRRSSCCPPSSIGLLAWHHAGRLGAGGGDPTPAIFALLLVPAFFAPLRAFSAAYHERLSAEGAAAALAPLLLPEPAPPGLLLEEIPRRVVVAFSDVRLMPDPARPPALDGLTFRVSAGETLVLAGPSGAGKTSVLRLLMGFARPDGGRVAINGQDATALRPSELRRLSAYVGQRPHLFRASLRENIRLARPDADGRGGGGGGARGAGRGFRGLPAAGARHDGRRGRLGPVRPGRRSASRSPAPFCATRRWCCWTSRPRISIPARKRRWWKACAASASAAPPSSPPTRRPSAPAGAGCCRSRTAEPPGRRGRRRAGGLNGTMARDLLRVLRPLAEPRRLAGTGRGDGHRLGAARPVACCCWRGRRVAGRAAGGRRRRRVRAGRRRGCASAAPAAGAAPPRGALGGADGEPCRHLPRPGRSQGLVLPPPRGADAGRARRAQFGRPPRPAGRRRGSAGRPLSPRHPPRHGRAGGGARGGLRARR